MRNLASALVFAACLATAGFAQNDGTDSAAPRTAPPPSAATPERAWVLMDTSKGLIVIELDGKRAPISVENFLSYVRKGYYDGTIFHRVKPEFMIQGGGFDTKGTQKETDPPIKNEYGNGLKNTVGTIAMARTQNPDSATSQFFINVVDNPFLDGQGGGAGYAVFGKVIGGMNAVNAIRAEPTGTRTLMMRGGNSLMARPNEDVPLELVVIKSVREASESDAKSAIERAAKEMLPDAPAMPGAPAAPKAPAAPGAPKAPEIPAAPKAPEAPAPPKNPGVPAPR